jgi:site-specific DNA-methyltransferase (adenine-specific)
MQTTQIGKSTLYLGDCMAYMATLPDKAFDLAIVDPPYGIGFDGEVSAMANNNSKKWKAAKSAGYERKSWDSVAPSSDYFNELFRVSKNQIIWGGNYFQLPQSSGWIFWDKGVAEKFTLSPGELAWTSFDKSLSKVEILWAGFRKCSQETRIHPTQKPVKLYEWLLTNYAKPGQRILDTHLGSGSSAIAAHYMGYEFVGCELDPDYYQAACNRIRKQTAQVSMFGDAYDQVERDEFKQESFL